MSEQSKPDPVGVLFAIRNCILAFLMFHAYRHFAEELSLPFLGTAFLLSLLLALVTQRWGLRFLPALACAALLPFLLRAAFFLLFRLIAAVDPAPESDFLFQGFDRDFYPALIPWFVVWVLNYVNLRHARFAVIEVLLCSYLLVLVFITESGFRINLYHPTFFVLLVSLFVLSQTLVLMMSPVRLRAPTGTRLARRGRGGLMLPGRWLARLRSTLNPLRAAADAGTPATARPCYVSHEQTVPARGMISLIIVLLMLLAGVIFLLLGRYTEEAKKAGGGLMEPTLFRFDFSRYIRLESEIDVSDDLVMLLRKDGPADKILIRRFILSGYSLQKGFHRTQNRKFETLPTSVSDAAEEFPDPGYNGRTRIEQEYFFVNFDPTSLVAINYPVRVIPLRNWSSSSFLRIYRVHSQSLASLPPELYEQGEPALNDELLRYYTEYGDDEVIGQLAREVTAAEDTYYGKVLALTSYLKDNYLYSLRPGPAEGGDQLHHFLFRSKKGYCSYFAFAMALMARSLGIPARVAVGFLVDPGKEVLNFYEIRAYQAHAWVEIYFGDYGWIEIDPTSENLAPNENLEFIFSFDFNTFSSLIEEILDHQQQLTEQIPEETTWGARLYRWGQGVMQGFGLLARFWYLILPLLLAISLALGKSHLYLRFLLARAPRRRIQLLYRFSLSLLNGVGRGRAGDESLMEFAVSEQNRHALSLTAWSESYLKAVFGDTFGNRDLEQSVGLYRQFIRSYRSHVPFYYRWPALLNPLSFLRKKR